MDRATFLQNQQKCCEDNKAPFFMPKNGICFFCNRDIIPELLKQKKDGTSLVTGCPLCNHSFCD